MVDEVRVVDHSRRTTACSAIEVTTNGSLVCIPENLIIVKSSVAIDRILSSLDTDMSSAPTVVVRSCRRWYRR